METYVATATIRLAGATQTGVVFYCCIDLPLIFEALTDNTDYFCNILKYSLVET